MKGSIVNGPGKLINNRGYIVMLIGEGVVTLSFFYLIVEKWANLWKSLYFYILNA